MRIEEVASRKQFPQMIDYYKCKIGLEIGVHLGAFSHFILDKSKLDTLYGIDPYLVDISETKHMSRISEGHKRISVAIEKLDKFKDRWILIRAKSKVVPNLFPDNYFDFIHIDGAHKMPYIEEDVVTWYPKCKIGGLFTGHDYKQGIVRRGPNRGDVIENVYTYINDWKRANNFEMYFTSEDRFNSWMMIKK